MPADKSDSNNVELVAESLEGGDNVLEPTKTVTPNDKSDGPSGVVNGAPASEVKRPTSGAGGRGPIAKFKKFTKRFNIYILSFALLLVLISAGIAIFAAVQRQNGGTTITSSSLSADTIKQLSKSDVTVGDPKQVLKVQSSAVFDGKVLVKDSLDVAGTIHVGGALSLPGITVSGDSAFESVEVSKTLHIGGDASVSGQLSVKKGISITGGATFGGSVTTPQVTTSKLQLLGDLAMTSHIIAGGPTPGRTSGILGAGGTSSISGSDTAGSIVFNTGSGPGIGCMVTVNFSSKFANTPRVVVTPNNAASAGLQYYVTRSTSSFSLCTTNNPASSTGYGFDYIVLG